MSAVFYFTSEPVLEKPTLDFKQTLKITQYVNEIKQRRHINGQTYYIEFSLSDLQSALAFFQTLKSPDSRSSLFFNDQNIDITFEHVVDLKFTKRYLPVNTSFELNNYLTPVQPTFIKQHKIPDFLINYTNNQLAQNLIEQEFDKILNTESVNVKIRGSRLEISYLWSDDFSELFLQPDLIIDKKIEASYQTLQKTLKNKDHRKVSLQEAMVELLGFSNNFKNHDSEIIFWSVLFASVDYQSANEYLNLNLPAPSVKLTLQNRYDLAKHFVFSAYLQQMGGNQFSSLIGEYKENKDASTRATKFSYSDVMANQSGILFSQVLSNKIESGQHLEFIDKIKDNDLTLKDDLFEDGIEAPSKEALNNQIALMNEQLKSLAIYQ